MTQLLSSHARGPTRRARALGVGLGVGLTVGAGVLVGSPAFAGDIPAADDGAVITVSAFADPSSALTGDCVRVSLDVTGLVDGIALQPIVATLNGPLDGVTEGDTVSGPAVGSIDATWGGAEWSYSDSCITAPVAGFYVWTVNDLNSDSGIDDTAHSSTIVTITDPVVVDPGDPENPASSGNGGDTAQYQSVDDAPSLARTGASEEKWAKLALVGGLIAVLGLSVVTADITLSRRRAARVSVPSHTEETK